LAVITGIAPSPAFLEAGTLAAGAPRAAPREACEVRRTAADFFESRLTALELFLVLVRTFPATAVCVEPPRPLKPPWPGLPPKKYAPKGGSGYGGVVFIDFMGIYHIFRKNQRFSREINALDGHKMACPLTGRRKFFVIG
jgi:hypothetical protein